MNFEQQLKELQRGAPTLKQYLTNRKKYDTSTKD